MSVGYCFDNYLEKWELKKLRLIEDDIGMEKQSFTMAI